MKRILLTIFNLFLIHSAFSQTTPLVSRWSYNTAVLIPKGKWESGLIQPFRYGVSQKIEVSSNILLMPLLPNAGIKVNLGNAFGFMLASEHLLSVPSVFLNTVSRKGTGGLLSPQFDFPLILGINNAILASKPIFNSALLSLKTSWILAIRTGKVDPLSTIDLPILYPRMAQYYKGTSLRFSASVKGRIFEKWNYEEAIQVFIATRKEFNFIAENTGNLMWTVGHSLRLRGGYILTYGNYPFGNHWQVWPTFDLVFGSRL
jgi:hypothetical protein